MATFNVFHPDEAGNTNLRLVVTSLGGQYLRTDDGTLDAPDVVGRDETDYQLAADSSVTEATGLASYLFIRSVSNALLPITLVVRVLDIVTGEYRASTLARIDASGNETEAVQVDMTQVVPTNAATGTVGEAYLAARAQGVGRWVVSEDGLTLTIYLPDETTPLRVFNLDAASNPKSRTPV